MLNVLLCDLHILVYILNYMNQNLLKLVIYIVPLDTLLFTLF